MQDYVFDGGCLACMVAMVQINDVNITRIAHNVHIAVIICIGLRVLIQSHVQDRPSITWGFA